MSTPGPTLYSPRQPRTRNGRRLGRPRGDAALLAVLSYTHRRGARDVAERLGISVLAASQALYRAQRRGLVECQRMHGYRLVRFAS